MKAKGIVVGVVAGLAVLVLSPGGMGEAGAQEAASAAHNPTAGNELGMEFVEVKAGSFQMGSASGGDNNERPVRTVEITRDFWMGKFEVPQRQYQALMGSNPSRFKGDDLPVESVSWNDAVRFCQELTNRERAAGRLPQGLVYRLPTEAEWEYAARGGHLARETTYAGSDDLDSVAWYEGNSNSRTQRVGTKAPNGLGLHDMSGNVWEWVHDLYQGNYSGLSTTDPSGPSSGSARVFRGGSWTFSATDCRVACRSNWPQSLTYFDLGFRVVVAAPVPADAP